MTASEMKQDDVFLVKNELCMIPTFILCWVSSDVASDDCVFAVNIGRGTIFPLKRDTEVQFITHGSDILRTIKKKYGLK